MNGNWIARLFRGGIALLGMAYLTTGWAAGEKLSLSISPALANGITTAVVKILNPADVEAFSLELSFASGQSLSLRSAAEGWFTRGGFFPTIPFGPAPAPDLNHYKDGTTRTRVYLDGFKPSAGSGAVSGVTFKVNSTALVDNSQVISLAGKFWSHGQQREVTFLPVSATFTVGAAQDPDGDGVAGSADNCPWVNNPDQTDSNGNGVGDACEGTPPKDTDRDGIPDNTDNCPLVFNPDQADSDHDGIGDACESTPDFCWDCLPRRSGWRSLLH